jgi:hypothetical protein
VASNDTFVLVDVSDPTTPNKKIQQQNLFLIPDGSAGTPAVRFLNDTDVGLFRPTTNTLAFATGGSERLRIDSSGRLGLGTSNPGSKLHIAESTVSGKTTVLTLVAAGTVADDGPAIDFIPNGSSVASASIVGARPDVAGVDGYLGFYTNNATTNSERMRIDSSGNVGIGTTSPGGRLTIAEASAGTAVDLLSSDGNGAGTIGTTNEASTANGIAINASRGGGKIVFSTASNERARIDSSGRLLVGTSTSASTSTAQYALLQVQGYATVPTNEGIFALKRGESSTSMSNADKIGAFLFTDKDGGDYARIEAYADSTPGSGDYPGRLVFSVTADGASSPTEAMRIKNTRVINFSNAPVYADNAAAKTGGLVDGDVYRTSTGDLKIVYT